MSRGTVRTAPAGGARSFPAGGARPGQGLLLIAVAALLWSSVGVAQRLMTVAPALDPALLGMLRTCLGGVTLLVLAPLAEARRDGGIPVPLSGLAAFAAGGAVFQVTLFQGFQTIGVSITVAVTLILPPAITAIAEAFAQRSLSLGIASAIVTAALGTVLALSDQAGFAAANVSPVKSALLYLVNGLGFLCMVKGLRRMQLRISSLRASGLGLLGVALLLFAYGLLTSGTAPLASLGTLGGRDWLIMGYIGFLATGGAYAAFSTGLARCHSPAAALAAMMIETVFAAALAFVLLRELLSVTAMAGCGLLLVAMVMLYMCERSPSARAARE